MPQTRWWALPCALTVALAGQVGAWDKPQAAQSCPAAPCYPSCVQSSPPAGCRPCAAEAPAPARQGRKCCCDGTAECAEGCKPEACPCKEGGKVVGGRREGRKCCCDKSAPCAGGCKPDACPCEDKPMAQVGCKPGKRCCDSSAACSKDCKADGCCCAASSKCSGKCCCGVKGKHSKPGKCSIEVVVCPCSVPSLFGLSCFGGECDCLGWMAEQITKFFANGASAAQASGAVAPCVATVPMPAPLPLPCMPPMPGVPPAPGIIGMVMPGMIPCAAAPAPACCAMKPAGPWKISHAAEGVCVSGPNLEARCDCVIYSGCGDCVVLQGHVQLKYHKDSDKAEIHAERISLNIHDGSIHLNVPKAGTEPVTEAFQFWSCPMCGN